jgi:hypothetical protein
MLLHQDICGNSAIVTATQFLQALLVAFTSIYLYELSSTNVLLFKVNLKRCKRSRMVKLYDIYIYLFIHIYLFNRNWVDTRWQQYSTNLHTNNTRTDQLNAQVFNLFQLSVYFCLTCFGLSFSPFSEADIQLRQWFKSPGYGVSTPVRMELV